MAEATSGNSAIDSKYQYLIQQGIEFPLFGVTCKVLIQWQGDVAVSASSGAASFSGTAQLLAPFGLTCLLTLNIAEDGNYVVRYTVPNIWRIVQRAVQPVVSASSWQTLTKLVQPYLSFYVNCVVILASQGGEDEQYGEYVSGANFFAQVQASDIEPLRSLDRTFPPLRLHDRSLVLHTACTVEPGLSFVIEGKLVLNQSLGTNAVVVNNLDLRVDASSEELAACVAVTFDLHVAGENLSFVGSLGVDAVGSITIAGSLDSPNGEWKDPFGARGITVDGMGVQVSATAEAPFFGLGVRGGLHIGDGLIGGDMAILVDPSDPAKSIFYMSSPEGLDLQRLLTAVVDSSLLPTDLPQLSIKNLLIYVAPHGGFVANKEYTPGFALSGDVNLFGWHAGLSGMLSYLTGGSLQGKMDHLLMLASPTVVEISGVGSENALVNLNFTAAARGLGLSGDLRLASFYNQAIDVHIDQHGFSVLLDKDRMGFYGNAALKYYDGVFSGQFSTGIDLMVRVGNIASITGGPAVVGSGCPVVIKANASMYMEVSSTRILERLSFSFDAFGEHKSYGPVEVSLPIRQPEDLANLCMQYFGNAITDYFTSKVNQAGQVVFQWVQANWAPVARQAATIFRFCNATCASVTAGLEQTYRMAPIDAARTLDGALYGAADIARSLMSVYALTQDSTGVMMRAAGMSSSEIATACKDAFSWTANHTARYMGGTLSFSDDTVAQALKSANYAKSDIQAAMSDVFNWGADEWNQLTSTISGWF